jgi:hypothetical protein
MKTFTIDANNKVVAHTGDTWAGDGTVKFNMEQELAALAETWPSARLVEIWNRLPDAEPVTKFTSRKVAVSRIWKRIQTLDATAGKPAPAAARKSAVKAVAARTEATGDRQTKTARVIDLLKQPAGATLKQLMDLTDWQPHSVRGFLSAQLSKRLGLRIKSFLREGERVYRIRGA